MFGEDVIGALLGFLVVVVVVVVVGIVVGIVVVVIVIVGLHLQKSTTFVVASKGKFIIRQTVPTIIAEKQICKHR